SCAPRGRGGRAGDGAGDRRRHGAIPCRRAGAGARSRTPASAATPAAAPPPAGTPTRRGGTPSAGAGGGRATVDGTRRLAPLGDLRPGDCRTTIVIHRRSLRLGRGEGGARRADGIGRAGTPVGAEIG